MSLANQMARCNQNLIIQGINSIANQVNAVNAL